MELSETNSPPHHQPTRKFMYCISIRDITPYFLVPTVTLARGITGICAFDIIVSLLVFLLYLIPEIAVLGLDHSAGLCTLFLHVGQFICIIPAIIGITAIKGKYLAQAAVYMHWKIWEPALLTILQVLDLMVYATYLKFRFDKLVIFYSIVWVVVLTVIRVMYDLYTAYAVYSFIVMYESGNGEPMKLDKEKTKEMVMDVASVYKVQP